MLGDVFPAGWHGCELADLPLGESVAVYGAGPVGIMAAYSAKLKGAAELYVVDRIESRLELAEEHCGATTSVSEASYEWCYGLPSVLLLESNPTFERETRRSYFDLVNVI